MRKTDSKPKIEITKEYICHKPMRLIDFLNESIKQSKNNIKMLLSKRYIAVNGMCTTKYDFMLSAKDVVQLAKNPIPEEKIMTLRKGKPPKDLTNIIDIIYEDIDFIAINKPAGLLSVESDKERINTAYALVMKYLKQKSPNLRAFQVHRLDKDTSGVLLFCKNDSLRELLKDNWNDLVIKREYEAVVEGMIEEGGTHISYLKKDPSTNFMYDTHNPKLGQKAITNYKVIKKSKKYTYLLVNIETGRKNQIRVAFKDMGHPIIGDDKYGNAYSPINRLGLHASVLSFKHPLTDMVYLLRAPSPSSFRKIFK